MRLNRERDSSLIFFFLPLSLATRVAPHGRPRGRVASLPLGAPCAPPARATRTLPRQPPPGLGRHITCRYVKPFFCEFLIRNSIYKSIKNPKKCIKLKKFIFLKIQLLLISNFLHWITNSFLFNIISFTIYFERRNQDELKFT